MTEFMAWLLSPYVNAADLIALFGAGYFAIILCTPTAEWPAWWARIFNRKES